MNGLNHWPSPFPSSDSSIRSGIALKGLSIGNSVIKEINRRCLLIKPCSRNFKYHQIRLLTENLHLVSVTRSLDKTLFDKKQWNTLKTRFADSFIMLEKRHYLCYDDIFLLHFAYSGGTQRQFSVKHLFEVKNIV